MRGLLLKDLLNLRASARPMLFVLVFYIIFAAATKNFGFVTGMSPFICVMLLFTTFSLDEYNKWDRFILSGPVSRSTLVGSKYLFALLLILAGGIIAFLTLMGFAAFSLGTADFSENVLAILAVMVLAVLLCSAILPLLFKFGVEKGRLLLLLVFAVPSGAIYLLHEAGVTLPSESQLLGWLTGAVFVIFALFVGSYFLSCKIYEKKDL